MNKNAVNQRLTYVNRSMSKVMLANITVQGKLLPLNPFFLTRIALSQNGDDEPTLFCRNERAVAYKAHPDLCRIQAPDKTYSVSSHWVSHDPATQLYP
jgi:hypothetical protein